MTPPFPHAEAERVAALKRYHILDTEPEAAFDDITKLAAFICDVPMAVISLVDSERQWFKSKLGTTMVQTRREDAFCAYAILDTKVMVIENALEDERFAQNPMVLNDPKIRFYAGAPVLTPEGHALGVVCALDRKPRHITPEQTSAMERLARIVMTTLEWRSVSAELAEAVANVKTLSSLLPMCAYCHEVRNDDGYWEQVEAYIQKHTDAKFTHGICPKCAERRFSAFLKPKKDAV